MLMFFILKTVFVINKILSLGKISVEMVSYVRAIYDFVGESGTPEISISVGEVLEVIRTDIGDGWWEGKNSSGRTGLFPAAYVEVLSAAEVQLRIVSNNEIVDRYEKTEESIDGEDWEDDWDDDNDTYSEIEKSYSSKTGEKGNVMTINFENKTLPPAPIEDNGQHFTNYQSSLKKSGMFVKSSDTYILGLTNKEKLSEKDIIHVVGTDNAYFWKPSQHQYTVLVTSPKKESKFKGMKTFIAYQLTPSFTNMSVSRRYKHFDWLHERLIEKFCLIPIPPLPDKQISGRYEEQFVEHRRVQLQEFVDWVCRHPVLSTCEVWYHFLTCNDDKIWKLGKRKAEKDTFVGVSYCVAISAPEKQLLPSFFDPQIENSAQFIHSMDISVRNLLNVSAENVKRYQTQSKKDFQRIGESFSELAKALRIDELRSTSENSSLSESIGKISGVYLGIGQLFGDQPKNDWIPFSDRLHIYRGVLSCFPEILSTHKGAIQKKKECERLVCEQKMSNVQLADVNRRVDVMSYAVLAELGHFKQERDKHLKKTLMSFIEEQIKFYSGVVSKLQEAYKHFDSM